MPHFNIIPFHQAYEESGPVEWILPGVLEKESILAIAGPPGSGKSFLSTSLATTLATGLPWLDIDTWKPPHPCRVLYISPEGFRSNLGRIYENFTRHDLNVDDYDIGVSRSTLSYAKLEDFEEIITWEPDVIFIDTWARAIPGVEENSATQIGKVINDLDNLRAATGCSVVLVHHTAVDKPRMRGSSALKGAVDTEIIVTDERDVGGTISMKLDKSKNGVAAQAPIPLEITQSPAIPSVGYISRIPTTI